MAQIMKHVKPGDAVQSVSFPHSEISRLHAKIIVTATEVLLCDLNETNGCAVKKTDGSGRINVMNSQHALQAGDIIIFAPIARKVHSYAYVLERVDTIDRENLPDQRGTNAFKHRPVAAPAVSPNDSLKRKRANSSLMKQCLGGSPIHGDAKKEVEAASISPKVAPQIKRLKPSSNDSFEKGNTSGQTIPSTTEFKTPEKVNVISKLTATPTKPVVEPAQPVENISEEFTCVMCMELLIRPCIVTDCGHRLCEYCIDTWMYKFRKEPHVKCPTCNDVIKNRIRDYAIANIIEKLELKMSAADRDDRLECRAEREQQMEQFKSQKEADEKREKEEREKANKSDDTNIGFFSNLNITIDEESQKSNASTQSRRGRRKRGSATRTMSTRRRSARNKQ